MARSPRFVQPGEPQQVIQRGNNKDIVFAIATNKAWVLGNDRFRRRIESLIYRQTAPKTRGGNRKSSVYRDNAKINRV